MSNLDFIYKRKSIRDYKDEPVPKEDILKMLDAATYAPSPNHRISSSHASTHFSLIPA